LILGAIFEIATVPLIIEWCTLIHKCSHRDNQISHVRRAKRFKNLKNLDDELSIMLVNKKHEQCYVCKLLKLVLILPIATASVESVFLRWIIWRINKGIKWVMAIWTIAWLYLLREFFNQKKDEVIINSIPKRES
jgi:hypothetical protein